MWKYLLLIQALLIPVLFENVCLKSQADNPQLPFLPTAPASRAFEVRTSNFELQTSKDSLFPLLSLPLLARFATADNLGNTYIVTAANSIEKYASDGRFLTWYSDNRRGQVTWLDVSNPLKVLVWYADFRTVLFLDRSLTQLGEVNLIQVGYPDVRVVAAALDGNLWLYDEVNFRLLKITPEGEKRAESQSLNLLEYTPRQPALLREQDNRVYLADRTAGLGVFNAFGQFERTWKSAQVVSDFQVVDNQLIYLSDSSIVAERWPLPEHAEILLPDSLRSLPKWLGPRRLFVQQAGTLKVFTVR